MKDGTVTLYYRHTFPMERAIEVLRRIMGADCVYCIGSIVVHDRAGYFIIGWNDNAVLH